MRFLDLLEARLEAWLSSNDLDEFGEYIKVGFVLFGFSSFLDLLMRHTNNAMPTIRMTHAMTKNATCQAASPPVLPNGDGFGGKQDDSQSNLDLAPDSVETVHVLLMHL